MEIQHVNIKVPASTPDELKLDDAVLIFHRWIREKKTPEMLIDVADYAHVPLGPGVMVIGHHESYSVDIGSDNTPGLLFNAKVKQDGENADRIAHALGRAMRACDLLEQDELWKGKVKFSTNDVRVIINDRLLAPNTSETFEALKADIEAGVKRIYGGNAFSLEFAQGDSRERFTVLVKSSSGAAAADLASAATA